MRFPSSPRALAVLAGSALGAGFGFGAMAGESAAGAVVTAGSSGNFLFSTGADSVAGAEINALI